MNPVRDWEHMHLTKHHGLGNDFLIVVDPDGVETVDASLARRVCHRHTGIGADGLMHATSIVAAGDGRWSCRMKLFNPDGSVAEMSGNGIRCFGQAVLGHLGETQGHLDVTTDGGPRRLDMTPGPESDSVKVRVDMDSAKPGPDLASGWDTTGVEPLGQVGVDMGNPHLVVLVADPNAVDLAVVGPMIEAQYPAGLNVEFVRVTGPDVIELKVWERGAGITRACGTGACAAAHAAHGWGLVGTEVEVRMPGGSVTIELGDPIHKTGPSAFVATVEIRTGDQHG
ncbi:MAG: diaminopimelate epimerase [Actinomycetia bacterium]|nr:diaminopimelate epimerase [Actinomycetes bacterium]